MKTKRTIKALTLILLVLLFSLTLGSSAMAAKVFRIGVLGPFTGVNSRGGDEIRGGVVTAFEEINYRIGDYKIELVYIDSEANPGKAITAYKEAVLKGKIDCGLGSWYSPVVMACMEIMAQYKIPHFFGVSSAPGINEKFRSNINKYGYLMSKGWPIGAKVQKGYVDALNGAIENGEWKPKNKTAVVIIEDTDTSRDTAAIFKRDFEAGGWQILGTEIIKPGEMDLYPIILKLKKYNSSLILGCAGTPALSTGMIKQMKELGLNTLTVMHGLGWVGEWYKLVGRAADTVLDQQSVVTSKELQTFIDNYKKRWKHDPSLSVAVVHYDAAKFFIKLAKYAHENYGGDLNKKTMYKVGREQLWTGKISHKGYFVNWKYDNESIPDPIVGKGYWMLPIVQYEKGKSNVIYPPDIKTSELKIPK